jgi:hypothetical protein
MSEPTPVTGNRRRTRRRSPRGSTRVICFKNALGLGANLALALLDLSETGIRLQLKDPLPENQEVEINLDSLNHRRPLKVLGRVIWCLAAADGSHCAGIQFQRPLAYIDLQALVRV